VRQSKAQRLQSAKESENDFTQFPLPAFPHFPTLTIEINACLPAEGVKHPFYDCRVRSSSSDDKFYSSPFQHLFTYTTNNNNMHRILRIMTIDYYQPNMLWEIRYFLSPRLFRHHKFSASFALNRLWNFTFPDRFACQFIAKELQVSHISCCC